MKKFTAILTIVVLAAVVALASFVSVSANSKQAGDTAAQIQNDDFYTEASYVHLNGSGTQAGPDTLSFQGIKDRKTTVRVADLFDGQGLLTVHYTAKGNVLTVDSADLPQGVTSYTVTVADNANHVVATEVKNGQSKTRTGYAINKYSEAMLSAQQAN